MAKKSSTLEVARDQAQTDYTRALEAQSSAQGAYDGAAEGFASGGDSDSARLLLARERAGAKLGVAVKATTAAAATLQGAESALAASIEAERQAAAERAAAAELAAKRAELARLASVASQANTRAQIRALAKKIHAAKRAMSALVTEAYQRLDAQEKAIIAHAELADVLELVVLSEGEVPVGLLRGAVACEAFYQAKADSGAGPNLAPFAVSVCSQSGLFDILTSALDLHGNWDDNTSIDEQIEDVLSGLHIKRAEDRRLAQIARYAKLDEEKAARERERSIKESTPQGLQLLAEEEMAYRSANPPRVTSPSFRRP